MDNLFDKVKNDIYEKEENLSKHACKSINAIFLNKDKRLKDNELRSVFSRDTDRIIHSASYTRYIDKTQVYSFIKNDHITHRVLHVQLVSKIARTIGKILNLNLDLIEAIALGHDVGHTPFGHMGESFLNDICIKENIGYFKHNAQSVRSLKDIEDLNISLQTLDGILSHNGEMLQSEYRPKEKNEKEFLRELEDSFTKNNYDKKITPMTLEGCVVRICDIIAYIGRDIEDAILVGSIKREDIPKEITNILGNNNSIIVDTLIKDIIENSYGKEYLSFSDDVYIALMDLKKWNYNNIYSSKEACKNQDVLEEYFYKLYKKYYEYLDEHNTENNNSKNKLIEYIESRNKTYRENTCKKRIIIDYIAGQTDHYFLNECEYNFKEFKKDNLYK